MARVSAAELDRLREWARTSRQPLDTSRAALVAALDELAEWRGWALGCHPALCLEARCEEPCHREECPLWPPHKHEEAVNGEG